MRKILVATAVAATLSAGAFLTSGANAMTTAAPAGIRLATEGVNQAEQVRYVCWRVRRAGGWRRVCQWRPNYGYRVAPRYYGGYQPYYYRPYRPYGYGYGYGRGYGYGYGRPGVTFRF